MGVPHPSSSRGARKCTLESKARFKHSSSIHTQSASSEPSGNQFSRLSRPSHQPRRCFSRQSSPPSRSPAWAQRNARSARTAARSKEASREALTGYWERGPSRWTGSGPSRARGPKQCLAPELEQDSEPELPTWPDARVHCTGDELARHPRHGHGKRMQRPAAPLGQGAAAAATTTMTAPPRDSQTIAQALAAAAASGPGAGTLLTGTGTGTGAGTARSRIRSTSSSAQGGAVAGRHLGVQNGPSSTSSSSSAAVQAAPPIAAAPATSDASAGGGAAGFVHPKGVPAFLVKLYSMINDPATDALIYWARNGRSFFSESAMPLALAPTRARKAHKLMLGYALRSPRSPAVWPDPPPAILQAREFHKLCAPTQHVWV